MFSTPVQLRFTVSADQLEAGLLAVARSSDGSIEPLELDVVEEGGSTIVIAELDHFTRGELHTYRLVAEIDFPEELAVGEFAELRLATATDVGRVGGPVTVDYRSDDQWKFSHPWSSTKRWGRSPAMPSTLDGPSSMGS